MAIVERGEILNEDTIQRLTEANDVKTILLQKEEANVNEYAIIYNTLQKDPTNTETEAINYIYKQLRNSEPPDEATARDVIDKLFFSEKRYDLGDVGRYRLNKKLNLNIDDNVRALGEIFRQAGHELYLVGGAVRDWLLGLENDDWDFTTDALPEGEKTEENVLRMRKEFIPYYDVHNADLSRPYPGIPELLKQLQDQHILLAVASNKYQSATRHLVAHYFPDIQFCAVFGQREGVNTKPDPTIVHDILSIAQIDKNDVLYVGDSGVDMQTAANAAVTACGVTWGFRPRTELEAFNPDFIVDAPAEIARLLSVNI